MITVNTHSKIPFPPILIFLYKLCSVSKMVSKQNKNLGFAASNFVIADEGSNRVTHIGKREKDIH